LCALTHARQTKVPGSIAVQDRRIDALTVIAHTKLKLAIIVPDLHFNATRACVPEGIAQSLAPDPIDVVTDDWPHLSRRAFDSDIEAGCVDLRVVVLGRRELVAQRAERDGEIVCDRRGSAEALDSVTSLANGVRAILERCF